MKKLIYALSFCAMFLTITPAADAKGNKEAKEELTAEQKVRLSEIESRVSEIKSMDFSELSNAEMKEVKTELKEMKAEARQLGGGVYLSIGAILVIILLLILLT
ncbi:hypothetical protein M3O96_15665 [Aquiflexum sp. TKW24L]|uniref:hypothetical protein n=1 Tax=Aquiflexum sp. TKW24L TaxID=2942212 RepID=UPI0020BD8C76|nr:hypothetical protein [Aquiflexum sp. TKW24L]MCL6260540.1 hypothetical protein [Aquiflexum sp. TKW24L]